MFNDNIVDQNCFLRFIQGLIEGTRSISELRYVPCEISYDYNGLRYDLSLYKDNMTWTVGLGVYDNGRQASDTMCSWHDDLSQFSLIRGPCSKEEFLEHIRKILSWTKP